MRLMNEEKCHRIAAAISQRRGRIMMAAAMVVPISGGASPRVKCHDCAMRMTKDCEDLRPDSLGEKCWVPVGTIPVVDERLEGKG